MPKVVKFATFLVHLHHCLCIDKMIDMRNLKFVLFAVFATIFFAGCSDEEKLGMTFSKTGLYFQWGGEPQTISYTTQDAVSIEVKRY